MGELFLTQVLPPDRRRYPQCARLPGVAYWPYAEDPRVVPWKPTHRIHYVDGGQERTVDVMFVICNDVTLTWDGYPKRQEWYGYEREQWVPGGSTGWAFIPEHDYPGHAHRLHNTAPMGFRIKLLGMERLG